MAKHIINSISGKEARYILLQNHINQSWLSSLLGISPQTLSSRLNATVFKIGYQMEINKVTGKRIFEIDMASITNDANRVPIIDLRMIDDLNMLTLEDILKSGEIKPNEYVTMPGLRGCIGVLVYGDSMSPEYRSGDIVFIRLDPELDNIVYGRPYLIITKTNRLLRCIYQSANNEDSLRLTSLNEEVNIHNDRIYPDCEIKRENILYLYRVIGLFRREQI